MAALVSILIPCYNGAMTLHRAMEGLLSQTYQPIELVFINDGSTDNTEQVFQSYLPRFAEKGIQVQYVAQENRGLGGAIDAGLKVFRGAYLGWADADDILLPESVARRVAFLETHPDFSSVSSDAVIVDETNMEAEIGRASDGLDAIEQEDQFTLLLQKKSIFCAGCHLIRTSDFLAVNPHRSIYPSPHGQNWQLLLPIYYKRKHGFLKEPLYKYVVSDHNMTSCVTKLNFQDFITGQHEYQAVVEHTLAAIPSMPEQERRQYQKDFRVLILENVLYESIGKKRIFTYLWCLVQFLKIGRFRAAYFKYPFQLILKKLK